MEMLVDALDGVRVQAIGKNQQLLARVLLAPLPPGDGDLSPLDGVAGIDADAGPTLDPVGRALEAWWIGGGFAADRTSLLDKLRELGAEEAGTP